MHVDVFSEDPVVLYIMEMPELLVYLFQVMFLLFVNKSKNNTSLNIHNFTKKSHVLVISQPGLNTTSILKLK